MTFSKLSTVVKSSSLVALQAVRNNADIYMVDSHEYCTNPKIKVFTLYHRTVIGFSMFVVLCRCSLKRATH